MKIKFNDKEIELVYSFRSNVYFEQINGKTIDFSNFSSNDLITLFYCVFISSLQKAKLPIITMVDFLDVIDDNGGEKCVIEFSNWYVETLNAQFELLESGQNEEAEPKKKKVKKA